MDGRRRCADPVGSHNPSGLAIINELLLNELLLAGARVDAIGYPAGNESVDEMLRR